MPTYRRKLNKALERMVPEYSLLRKNLLHLSTRLANVSEDVKRELEDPDSRYSFGWSYGKEKQDGKLDKLKASFFANPILDVPTTEPSNIQCKISFLCSVGSDTMLLESSFSKGVRNARPSSFVEA
nr:Iron/ascorbate oxidoreductase [Ipomoea batatas]